MIKESLVSLQWLLMSPCTQPFLQEPLLSPPRGGEKELLLCLDALFAILMPSLTSIGEYPLNCLLILRSNTWHVAVLGGIGCESALPSDILCCLKVTKHNMNIACTISQLGGHASVACTNARSIRTIFYLISSTSRIKSFRLRLWGVGREPLDPHLPPQLSLTTHCP